MENKEILKKYIESFNLQKPEYSFNESWTIEGGFIEWLYFNYNNDKYRYCISCSYDPKFPKKHEYIFSKIDSYGREYFLYNGFSEKKLLEILKNETKIEIIII